MDDKGKKGMHTMLSGPLSMLNNAKAVNAIETDSSFPARMNTYMLRRDTSTGAEVHRRLNMTELVRSDVCG